MYEVTGLKNQNITVQAKLSDKQNGPRRSVAAKAILASRYDAAQTSSETSRYWANAGAFGITPDEMNNQSVRQTLKVRSRYEYNNGGYTKRIVNKTSKEVVGKRLKISVESDNQKFNQSVERDLTKWQKAIKLEKKLRTLVKDKMRDGEALALPYNNKSLKHSVQLDLALISCDRLTSPTINGMNDNNIDGVILDEMGINPIQYQITKYSGTYGTFLQNEFSVYPAEDVYHWFEQEYSEQHRGIPELTSTLDINAARRAYSKSVLSTAQMQSNFAMYMKTSSTNPDDAESLESMDEINLERNIVTVLPENADIGTIDASQPVDTFRDYNNEMVMEASAPGNLPHNMVKGSSENMNFSSARFDYYIMFGKDRDILRSDMESVILDDFIMRYIEEWTTLNYSAFPGGIPDNISVSYGYEVDKYINPLQETKADAQRIIKNEDGTALMSNKDYFASQGKDYKDELRQQVIEEKYINDLRLEILGESPEDTTGGEENGESNNS